MGEITHNSNVPALIAKLKYHGWDARQQAVEALVKIGKPAMHALCEALKDSNQYVRYSAADVLGEIGDNSAVHALIAAFDMFVRSLRAEPLVKIGKPAVPALSEALKDSNVYMRRSAAEALGKIGDNSAVPALIAALKDSDPSVRRSAAEALGKIGDNSSVPALCEAGKDSNVYVRRSAAEALVKIGKLAVPALCEALKDNDPSVRSSAAEALGKIGDNSAVPALCAALKDNDPSVRRSAAEALGKIGDNSVVPAL